MWLLDYLLDSSEIPPVPVGKDVGALDTARITDRVKAAFSPLNLLVRETANINDAFSAGQARQLGLGEIEEFRWLLFVSTPDRIDRFCFGDSCTIKTIINQDKWIEGTYRQRIANELSLRQALTDPLFGVVTPDGFSVDLTNDDGFLNLYRVWPMEGREARLVRWGVNTQRALIVFYGTISDVQFSDVVTMNVTSLDADFLQMPYPGESPDIVRFPKMDPGTTRPVTDVFGWALNLPTSYVNTQEDPENDHANQIGINIDGTLDVIPVYDYVVGRQTVQVVAVYQGSTTNRAIPALYRALKAPEPVVNLSNGLSVYDPQWFGPDNYTISHRTQTAQDSVRIEVDNPFELKLQFITRARISDWAWCQIPTPTPTEFWTAKVLNRSDYVPWTSIRFWTRQQGQGAQALPIGADCLGIIPEIEGEDGKIWTLWDFTRSFADTAMHWDSRLTAAGMATPGGQFLAAAVKWKAGLVFRRDLISSGNPRFLSEQDFKVGYTNYATEFGCIEFKGEGQQLRCVQPGAFADPFAATFDGRVGGSALAGARPISDDTFWPWWSNRESIGPGIPVGNAIGQEFQFRMLFKVSSAMKWRVDAGYYCSIMQGMLTRYEGSFFLARGTELHVGKNILGNTILSFQYAVGNYASGPATPGSSTYSCTTKPGVFKYDEWIDLVFSFGPNPANTDQNLAELYINGVLQESRVHSAPNKWIKYAVDGGVSHYLFFSPGVPITVGVVNPLGNPIFQGSIAFAYFREIGRGYTSTAISAIRDFRLLERNGIEIIRRMLLRPELRRFGRPDTESFDRTTLRWRNIANTNSLIVDIGMPNQLTTKDWLDEILKLRGCQLFRLIGGTWGIELDPPYDPEHPNLAPYPPSEPVADLALGDYFGPHAPLATMPTFIRTGLTDRIIDVDIGYRPLRDAGSDQAISTMHRKDVIPLQVSLRGRPLPVDSLALFDHMAAAVFEQYYRRKVIAAQDRVNWSLAEIDARLLRIADWVRFQIPFLSIDTESAHTPARYTIDQFNSGPVETQCSGVGFDPTAYDLVKDPIFPPDPVGIDPGRPPLILNWEALTTNGDGQITIDIGQQFQMQTSSLVSQSANWYDASFHADFRAADWALRNNSVGDLDPLKLKLSPPQFAWVAPTYYPLGAVPKPETTVAGDEMIFDLDRMDPTANVFGWPYDPGAVLLLPDEVKSFNTEIINIRARWTPVVLKLLLNPAAPLLTGDYGIFTLGVRKPDGSFQFTTGHANPTPHLYTNKDGTIGPSYETFGYRAIKDDFFSVAGDGQLINSNDIPNIQLGMKFEPKPHTEGGVVSGFVGGLHMYIQYRNYAKLPRNLYQILLYRIGPSDNGLVPPVDALGPAAVQRALLRPYRILNSTELRFTDSTLAGLEIDRFYQYAIKFRDNRGRVSELSPWSFPARTIPEDELKLDSDGPDQPDPPPDPPGPTPDEIAPTPMKPVVYSHRFPQPDDFDPANNNAGDGTLESDIHYDDPETIIVSTTVSNLASGKMLVSGCVHGYIDFDPDHGPLVMTCRVRISFRYAPPLPPTIPGEFGIIGDVSRLVWWRSGTDRLRPNLEIPFECYTEIGGTGPVDIRVRMVKESGTIPANRLWWHIEQIQFTCQELSKAAD